ncbi:MAG: hypothetical protein WCI27_05190 [Candidatus Omnitrophota bacterium]
MQDILSDFVSGGFYVTRFVERHAYVAQDMLPLKVLRMSSCISPFVPDTWAIEWACDKQEERLEKAEKFGLSNDIKGVVYGLPQGLIKRLGGLMYIIR